MAKVTKKELEEALDAYASLVELYPDNEAYLRRYASMLQTLGRKTTAILTLQHLHDVIAKRSPEEARAFAKEHPEIGRVLLDEMVFEEHDKHAIAGKMLHELLGGFWLKMHRKKLREGQAVCRANDLSDSLIIILEGNADAFIAQHDATRILVEHLSEMDIIGEHTFLHPQAMDIDVFVASESCVVTSVPRKKVLAMIADNPHLETLLKQRARFRLHVRTLARSEVFQTMPLKLTKYLARKLTVRHFPANAFIYDLKKPAHGIDIVLKGEVCYLAQNKAGKKVMLAPLPQLSIAGDTSLHGGETAGMAELVSKTPSSLAHIAYDDLLNVSTAYPPLKEKLMQHADMQKLRMMQQISRLSSSHD